MRLAVLLCAILSMQGALAAASPADAKDCRVGHPVAGPGEELSWSGACKDGFADGPGVLVLRAGRGQPDTKYEVTLVHGEISGEGTRTASDGKYIGTFKDGIPDGKGYFKFLKGVQYEGDVADGRPNGVGTMVWPDRSRYDGQWKDGERDGAGHMIFAIGGSYDGQWKKNRFNGKGVLTYAGSGRRYEGEFRNGHPLGTPDPVPLPQTKYAVKRDVPEPGSMLRRDEAIIKVPPATPYEELTPEQQRVVRADYPALDPEDEPPYPLHGPKELLLTLGKISGRLEAEGDLILYVLVGADGKAVSAAAVGNPDQEFTRTAMTAAMLEKYKPARCHGQPCAMIYPLNFNFTLEW